MIPAIFLILIFLLFFRGADISRPYPPLKRPAPDPRGYRPGFRPEPARKKAAKRDRAEKQNRALAAAMHHADTYTQAAYKHNLEYADSLSRVTSYDVDAIKSVQEKLTHYGKVKGEDLDKLTRATLDLATAQGIDLESAATLVIKKKKPHAKVFGAPPVLHPRIVFMESPSNWFN
ncbi:MAG TPA: hypothetical protein PK600_01520 [Deltaproteobacteria bacterium]|nr:hypothetical protein [Deltaproteobacteria bacterium]